MSKVCDYYFAPHSPWSYLGHQRFIDIAGKYKVKIALKPCDLSRVFAASGGLPLAKRAPQRQAYRLIELQRWSDFLQVPMHVQPQFFPVTPDPAARLIIAAQIAHGNEAALALSTSIMRAMWAEQKNIADEATLIGLACDADLDGKQLVKSAETAAVQADYERNTNDAIAANVFGAPWYVYKGEGFWGQDRLDFLERAFAS
ncbi:2-hydroxychromene-2-carboxylate isomerase [Undibacterium macrobrachii]|uniref:2-hydroxychromene-2-carboxylate isomerase n=1 Tax=Undibacterium macrobrachii TaxID=1119058 RepID=A0ABQ2X8A4_9BURK|nr:2-hydroxychromene-2-carboxylate isomerase [Undibacterium macrobrachii]GGX03654.1 2-hydroxychromene-2-carboxylate isomerase [Undibacterium macrobrachii]